VPDGTPPPLLAHLLSLIPSGSKYSDGGCSSNSVSDDFVDKRTRTWTEHEITTYISSARELDLAFRYRDVLGKAFSTWDALRVWPMAISEAYLDMLARKHEGALVLLGFYCVLLKMVESRWVVTFPFESLRILALQCSSQELCNVYVLTYLPLTDGISPTARNVSSALYLLTSMSRAMLGNGERSYAGLSRRLVSMMMKCQFRFRCRAELKKLR